MCPPPCAPQLSLRFEAIVAILQVLPLTLFVLQLRRDISGGSSSSSRSSSSSSSTVGAGYGGGWLSAAAVGVASSLLSVALSCATDLHCRRSFLRQEREQERVRQQQGQQGQGQELTKQRAAGPGTWGQQLQS